jgi:hypothetical protein
MDEAEGMYQSFNRAVMRQLACEDITAAGRGGDI